MALNKNIRTKIKALQEKAKIQPVKECILDLTQKFFDYNIKQINYTKNIGQWKKENCHFYKHKPNTTLSNLSLNPLYHKSILLFFIEM